MNPPNYQAGDLVAWRHGGDRPGDPRRYARVLIRWDDLQDGEPGFSGETWGGAGDGAPVGVYDRQIVRVLRPTEGTAT